MKNRRGFFGFFSPSKYAIRGLGGLTLTKLELAYMFPSAVADENVYRSGQEETVLEIFGKFVNKYALKIQPRNTIAAKKASYEDF